MAESRGTKRNLLLAVGLTIFGGLCGCGQQGRPASQVLHRGLGGEPSTLDPAAAVDSFSQEVLRDLYEGLTAESPKGDVIPGVASSWTVDPGGTQYTFRLRSDARWSNGRPVRAQDFIAAWRRVVDPKQASPVADDLRVIAGAASIISGKLPTDRLEVYAPDDRTLTVKLARPSPYLPQLLTHSAAFPIYSDSNARSHGSGTWVSNGAYVLAAWLPGSALELARNEAYWDRANVRIPRVEYQIVTDEGSQFARYRAGQLDLTDTVPANALAALKREHSAELFIAPYLATAYYGFNLSAPPFAGNSKLRQALAMAIDRKRLVDALGFGQVPAYGFVPPGTWNYSPQSWQWRDLDPAGRLSEAKLLYAAAGYTTAKPLHIRLLFHANPVIRNTAIMIARMWKEELGIDTALVEEEYRVFLESRHDKSRWEVARLGWTADYNDASNFLDTFRQHSNNNDSGYVNPSFDALLDEAERTSDAQERRQLLQDSERMMLSEYPVVPIYFFVTKRLVKPFVLGLQSNPLNRVPSKTLSLAPH